MSHIHDKIDFTVEVFVVYKDKVLLRKHDKYKKWLSVGGHIELNEDPNQAAIREVKEEIGLDITLYDKNKLLTEDSDSYHELIPPVFLNRHKISDSHEHVTLTYCAKTKTDQITSKEEVRWFSVQELDDLKYNISETIKFYSKEALKRLIN